MSKFIDGHDFGGLTKEKMQKAVKSVADEFGVTTYSVCYSEKEGKAYCISEGPNKEAIEKHHEKFGITCDFITEINQV